MGRQRLGLLCFTSSTDSDVSSLNVNNDRARLVVNRSRVLRNDSGVSAKRCRGSRGRNDVINRSWGDNLRLDNSRRTAILILAFVLLVAKLENVASIFVVSVPIGSVGLFQTGKTFIENTLGAERVSQRVKVEREKVVVVGNSFVTDTNARILRYRCVRNLRTSAITVGSINSSERRQQHSCDSQTRGFIIVGSHGEKRILNNLTSKLKKKIWGIKRKEK